jgi:hypothetical protein
MKKDSLQELTLAGTRITNNADIEITTQISSFRRPLMNTTHELQEKPFFDDLVAVDCRSDALHQPLINAVRSDHGQQFLVLLLRERSHKSLLVRIIFENARASLS